MALIGLARGMALLVPTSSLMDGKPICDPNSAAIIIINPIREKAKGQGVTPGRAIHAIVYLFTTKVSLRSTR